MIEKIIIDHLIQETGLIVEAEVPKSKDEYIVIERTGGGCENHINRATIAVQSCSKASLFRAATINDMVLNAMANLVALPEISRCQLNSTYNFTNPQTEVYRYQAVFDVVY